MTLSKNIHNAVHLDVFLCLKSFLNISLSFNIYLKNGRKKLTGGNFDINQVEISQNAMNMKIESLKPVT